MSTLYIYYRVQSGRTGSLATAVRDMQARLRGLMPGLSASLQQRLDGDKEEGTRSGAEPTWMETYHFNGHADQRAWAAFEFALAREVQMLPPGIAGPRRAERFAPLGESVPAGRRIGEG